jgi:hypothetical protein
MTSRITLRQLMMIQATLKAMATATRQAPSVMERTIALRRLVIRIHLQATSLLRGRKGPGINHAVNRSDKVLPAADLVGHGPCSAVGILDVAIGAGLLEDGGSALGIFRL